MYTDACVNTVTPCADLIQKHGDKESDRDRDRDYVAADIVDLKAVDGSQT